MHLPWGWNTGETGPVESRPTPDPSELHNAAVEPICLKYLDLRYQLMPYTYTITREAHDTGMPMMRALWLEFPNDSEAANLGRGIFVGKKFTRRAGRGKSRNVAPRLFAEGKLV